MYLALCGVFFLSGLSALVFETLWFRLAGLTFGNSVYASSVVLASFMCGLAIGNALAARYGDQLARPVRSYAILEVVIGAMGFGLVVLFPHLNTLMAPAFRPVADTPVALNLMRLTVGFALMVVPASAMGATLPFMVRGLGGKDRPFTRRLGLLYGCNTLGAVAGALAGEVVLVPALGIRGSGLAALGINLVAAALAWMLSPRFAGEGEGARRAAPAQGEGEPVGSPASGSRWPSPLLLGAAFLSGAILLALEVVWFRFLLLYTFGTSLAFAVMLAVVLGGIGIGGAVASWRSGSDAASTAGLAAMAGVLTIVSFGAFVAPGVSADLTFAYDRTGAVTFWRAMALMFPTSFLSGVLFTRMGALLHDAVGSDSRAVGLLALFNTTGAMIGALAGGFVLLPRLGMERSVAALAIAYGAVAFGLVGSVRGRVRWRRVAPGLALLAVAFVVFPRGSLRTHVFPRIVSHLSGEHEVALIREGITETVLYLRRLKYGQTYFYRLLTNGHSMSATNTHAQHYMKLYAYLPVAMHPDPKRALLISYGCGQTAKALTDEPRWESIDVVDISREIIEATDIVFDSPASSPRRDPRVTMWVEDGRFFLQTTDRRYDLITGEPPPPTAAGTVNLYTREYFQLVYDRLAPGGMATYWLPHHALSESAARGIVRAFAEVFEESSLWLGCGEDWMLFGVREPGPPVSAESFRRQWTEPAVAPTLLETGLEFPEQLAAYFIADRRDLLELCGSTPPVTDDFPARIAPHGGAPMESRYVNLLEPSAGRRRFEASAHVRRLIPEAVRQAALPYFDYRYELHNGLSRGTVGGAEHTGLAAVYRVLTETPLRMLPLWLLDSSWREQEIVAIAMRGTTDPALRLKVGDLLLARRDFSGAVAHYRAASEAYPDQAPFLARLVLALAMSGDLEGARAALAARRARIDPNDPDWRFLQARFGFGAG
jgi:predicted membrane-bound spermidine synthase